jgi:antitoxin ParD1/3/4
VTHRIEAGRLRTIGVGFNPINTVWEHPLRTTQQLSITLPTEMADMVKTKIRTGEYATESEVIRDGLRALLARDRAVDSWLHQQVGPAYDALMSQPDRALTAEQVRAHLVAEHKKQQ